MIRRQNLSIIFITFLLQSCNNATVNNIERKDTLHHYSTVDYLNIKLDSNGHLPSNPYILAFTNGKKKIVFCGVNHLTDDSHINDRMFAKIEERFFAFKPDIAINEGGDVSKKAYNSRKDALLRDAEIGLTKILCDSLKIKTVNGDPSEDFEFHQLLNFYSKGELLAYIVTERLMWGLKGQQITDSNTIKKQYDGFLRNYIMKKGKIELKENEQTFNFYKSYYSQLLQRPFDLSTLEPTNPFEPSGKFQQIGRKSKEIRDQYLLQTVDSLLNKMDKIFIVFGGWHLLTCKPGLEEIIRRTR